MNMGKVTFVVDFEDGKEPPVSFAMGVPGGKLTAVLWADYRDDFFTDEQVDVVREALKWERSNSEDDEIHSEIINKMELMTL
jgi:hypothetical protein